MFRKKPHGPEREPSTERPKGRRFGRRKFLKGLIGAAAAAEVIGATGLHRGAAQTTEDAILGLRADIPAHLRRQSIAGPDAFMAGLGDSLEEGVGAKKKQPTSRRVAKKAGIPSASGGTAGSQINDIVRQHKELEGKIPAGARIILFIWTGHNNVPKDPEVLSAYSMIRRGPLNPVSWFRFLAAAKHAIDRAGNEYEKSVRHVVRASGSKSVTMILPSPVEDAPRAVQYDAQGRQTAVISIKKNPFMRMFISITRWLLGGKIVETAKKLSREGVDVGVFDSANSIHPSGYRGSIDEHPNDEAYDETASGVVSKTYRIRHQH